MNGSIAVLSPFAEANAIVRGVRWQTNNKSGTLFKISSGTRPSVQTVSDVFLKRTYSLDTSAFSALRLLTAQYKFTYLLTYLRI